MRRAFAFALLLLLPHCGDSSSDGGAGGGGVGGDSGDGGGPVGDGSDAQYCVDKINGYRATLGLAPYARWADGEACANDEAASDGMTGTAHGAFGSCGESAQDECPGWSGEFKSVMDGCLQLMWDEGPGDDFATHGHYINMSSTSYTEVACGFANTEGGVWAVQNFR